MDTIKAGDRVTAFDYRIWEKQGRDIGGNLDCWRPATVADVRTRQKDRRQKGGEMLYDLKFDHMSEVSRSHFRHAIRT